MQIKPISIGVIGCGEIAQLMHLPFLHELPQFEIAALCDISPSLLRHLGAKYNVASTYTDYKDLLSDPNVEAVVICNNDHGPIVWDTVAAGKHFVVEKPVAYTLAETAGLVEAVDRAGIVAMVGYMKLFDPGYEFGLGKIAGIGKPRSIRIHDFAGTFERYGKLYTQYRPSDVPKELVANSQIDITNRIETALGPDRKGFTELYVNLLMLGSHDLAVLRGAFGTPERVAYARALDEQHVLAVLDYADSVPAVLEIAYGPSYEWWDEVLEVRGERDEVRIEFQNPYLRNNTADVYLRESDAEWGTRSYRRGVPDTSFRRQWQHFYEVLRDGVPLRSTLAGGIADLALSANIVEALPASG